MPTPSPTSALTARPPEPPVTAPTAPPSAEVAALQARVRDLEAEQRALEIAKRDLEAEQRVRALEVKNRDLERENRVLALQVQDLRQQLWGKKSERYVGAGPAVPPRDLFAELGSAAAAPADATTAPAAAATLLTPLAAFTPRLPPDVSPPAPARSAGRRPGRQPLDPSLPRELHRVPDPLPQQRVCPETGRPLVPGFTETLEVVARRPATYYVKRFERTVWVSDPQTAVRGAPLATPWPTGVWPRARVDVSVVAHLAAAHYAEHQPFYRLEQQLARVGVHLPRSTQVAWMDQLAVALTPLSDLLRDQILTSGYVHLDATPLQVCDPARPGATCEAALWAYRAGTSGLAYAGAGPVWYDFRLTKAMAGPQQVLTAGPFRGRLQTDGANGFDTLADLLAAQAAAAPVAEDATGPPAVTHLGCLAHCRRRYFKAVQLQERGAAWYLERINRLYRIDRRIAEALAHSRRGRAFTPTEQEAWRDRVRQRCSVPLFDRLVARAAEEALTVPPKTRLGEALQYLLGQQGPLRRCVTTPGVRLDNNPVENTMRSPRLGEKNWLFVGHPDAGPRLAGLYTVVENARQEGLDIEAYLIDVLTRLPETPGWELPQLLPRAWRQAREVGILKPTAPPPAK